MPCILKERTSHSPGIVTFTHNEALRGVPVKSERARKFLDNSTLNKNWIFGVHIQGDCSNYNHWPLEQWQSFVMWPESNARFLSNIEETRKIGLNCINFMPTLQEDFILSERIFDICVISRPSTLKRIRETLLIIRELMDRQPNFTAVIIAPDPRHIKLGNNCYINQDIDVSLFDLPAKLFSIEQAKRLSFICSSTDSFGRFPISSSLMNNIIRKSKFVMLASHKEGTPRVIAESLLNGTPCILSKTLISGINSYLNEEEILYISDKISAAADEIYSALLRYDSYSVNILRAKQIFDENINIPKLIQVLTKYIEKNGDPIEGRWFLRDLHMRLACHGWRHNYQFMNNDKLFFDWFDSVDSISGRAFEGFDPYDEDKIHGMEPLDDN